MPGTRVPKDLSHVRGFNYQSAATKDHTDHWLNYNPAHTDFELDLARRLNLDQARVFITYQAYAQGKETFVGRHLHLVRACEKRDIGVMITMMYPPELVQDRACWPVFREFAADLTTTLSHEPALAFWDVSNEPDYGMERWPDVVRNKMDHARHMADLFHELDTVTPVTIGAAFEPGMEALNDAVDVLSFHDYSPTRAEIRATLEKAKQFAAGAGKPVFDTEIGCVCRANPYDVTLEEHMKAGMGWYIWELMVTGQWGTVHGVFYQDGTVRDPSIAAAVLGFFRKRGPDIVPTVLDREGHVKRIVAESRAWLAQTDSKWEDGLYHAEEAANLLEAGELVPMRELPTREVSLMRPGQADFSALRALLQRYIDILEPHILEK